MAQEVRAYLDEDVYDDVCDEHESTGKSKSQIINDHVRDSIQASSSWFLQSFGQGLFVVGFVLAATRSTSFPVGLGVSFIGLGLMFWTQIQDHANNPNTSYWEAFKRTMGV